MDQFTPPNDLDAEMAVLGSLIIDNELMHEITLIHESFYRESHKIIFSTIKHLIDKQKKVDLVTLTAKLRKDKKIDSIGGAFYLTKIINSVVAKDNIFHYADIVNQCFIKRRLLFLSSEIRKNIFEESKSSIDIADDVVVECMSLMQETTDDSIVSMRDGLEEAINDFEKSENEGMLGIKTGFKKLDYMTGGFTDSDLIVIGARPKMGKTSFMLNLALNAAYEGVNVGIFSIEMTAKQLNKRAIVSDCGIERRRLERNLDIEDHEHRLLARSQARLNGLNIKICDTPNITMRKLKNNARKMVKNDGVQIIFVDYLGKIRREKGDKCSDLEHTGRTICDLKLLARELDIPVIVLSQLSRNLENRNDKRPIPADLRNSGEIEQEANMIMFLYRDCVYNPESPENEAELIVSANRDGDTGFIPLNFRGDITKFTDVG